MGFIGFCYARKKVLQHAISVRIKPAPGRDGDGLRPDVELEIELRRRSAYRLSELVRRKSSLV